MQLCPKFKKKYIYTTGSTGEDVFTVIGILFRSFNLESVLYQQRKSRNFAFIVFHLFCFFPPFPILQDLLQTSVNRFAGVFFFFYQRVHVRTSSWARSHCVHCERGLHPGSDLSFLLLVMCSGAHLQPGQSPPPPLLHET